MRYGVVVLVRQRACSVQRAVQLASDKVLLSPRGPGAGSSGLPATAASRATASTHHSTPHMSHNHITTLHYLIIGTTFTLNRYGHLTMLITPIGTIMLWKRSYRVRVVDPRVLSITLLQSSGARGPFCVIETKTVAARHNIPPANGATRTDSHGRSLFRHWFTFRFVSAATLPTEGRAQVAFVRKRVIEYE